MSFGKFAVDYEERINFDRLRKERLERAQKQLAQDGFGSIMTFSADNIRYLTSIYITTPNRPGEYQFVFCPRKGDPTFHGSPNLEEANKRMPWLKGRVRPNLGSGPAASDLGADSGTIQRQVDAVIELMEEAGVRDEPIGIDGTVLSAHYVEAFARRGITCKIAKSTMDKARMIKTVDEISIMRMVAANTEFAFAPIVEAIRPGVREMDLVGIGIKALYEQGCDHTEDLVCMSGYNTNPYNWTFTDRPIRPGDLVYIDVDGASYLGYKSCVYRTFCCGKATDKQKATYDQALGWLRDAIAACKPGNTNYDIGRAFPQDPAVWGHKDWSSIDPYCVAHGLGLSLHDRPFVAKTYMDNKGPEVELQPGMVLAVETYAGMKGERDGVRLEEMVLITENGPEVLSKFPIDKLMECWLPY
ncbi:Xaa-Pro peptidase family protein [Clostridium sp. SYSU_GA19001]|uniref:M24 family metallopeptidase n=1 Tax=Clostridium caldaquaticum TaxID=2940653 RepID=UPI0020771668|nr:Xaa-Pro peptidase family protein [Clostridium caldaquaticum]MCM8711250.1 Xaa-Pro peptidase family protein [Clostridium caldaquaticum]